MSLADELSGAFGGGRKRRGGGRRQQAISDDDDDDNLGQYGGAGGALDDVGGGQRDSLDGSGTGGGSLGAELAELAGSSRRSKRSTAKSSAATAGHGLSGDGYDDLDDLVDGGFEGADGYSAKSRGASGGTMYVQEADPLSDPSAVAGSAEAQIDRTTEQTCSALSEVLASTDAFLTRLRKLTTTEAIVASASGQQAGLPSSATVITNLDTIGRSSTITQQLGAADDTARLESYAGSLLRRLRETVTQREQQVRDLREVDRHMARAETADPDFLAKLADADEHFNNEADEAEADNIDGVDASEGAGTIQSWGEARRSRRRQDSTASADTEKGAPPPVVPKISSEPFTSEVTDTLAGLLQRSVTDDDLEGDGDELAPQYHSDEEDDVDPYDRSTSFGGANRSVEYDDGGGEDELGPGWDDPTYRGSRRGARAGREPSSGMGDLSLASVGSTSASKAPTTLPSLRTSSTLLIHSLSSLHETAQVHRATISSAERRLRALRLLLDGWKDEIVAARRSRAWIAQWEGREPEKDDLLMDDGSGKVDEVLAASLATAAAASASASAAGRSTEGESGAGASGSRYTGGSGITPGAYAQQQMDRFQRLLGEAEERAKALLMPLPAPRVGAAAA
ncbi:hypothetical protein OC842_004239 [Tilletia horrida]|uniref:Uncharacterized protein n=1 Tax=Tilletia horrida TaxID=155126 RepID=A0AAN6JK41_9BASI|nr:hypothetical protein OC842_004239 [Tilletia horrida]